jgi:S-ribosylhomocysteine lyase LuxS involved in autoinducer biosynthesis
MGCRTGLVLRVGSSENSNEVIETLFHIVRELPVSGRRQKQFVEHESDDADKNDIDAKPPIATNDEDY